MISKFNPLVAAVATAALLLAGQVSSFGQSTFNDTWTGGVSTASPGPGSWNTATNWDSGAVPTSNLDTILTFGGNTNYNSTDNIAGQFNLNQLVLNNTSGSASTLTGASNSLNFMTNSLAVNPTILQNGNGAYTLTSLPVTAAGPLSIGGTGSGNLTFASTVTDTGGFILNGSGGNTVQFTTINGTGPVTINSTNGTITKFNAGTNNFSGGLTLTQGILQVTGGTANVGTGTVAFNGGNFQNLSTTQSSQISNTITFGGTTTFNTPTSTQGIALKGTTMSTTAVSALNAYTPATFGLGAVGTTLTDNFGLTLNNLTAVVATSYSVAGTITENATLTIGSSLDVGRIVLGGAINGTGGVTINAPGANSGYAYFSSTAVGNYSYAGPTTINAGGIVFLANTSTALGTGNLVINGTSGSPSYLGNSGNIASTLTNGVTLNGNLVIIGASSGTPILTTVSPSALTGTVTLSGPIGLSQNAGIEARTTKIVISGTTSENAHVLTLSTTDTGGSTTGAGLSVTGNITNDGGLVLVNSSTNTLSTLSLSGVISGAGGLTYSGAGAVSSSTIGGGAGLAVANTFTGTTAVNSGTLVLTKNTGVAAVGGNVSVTGTGSTLVSTNAGNVGSASSISVNNGGTYKVGTTGTLAQTIGTGKTLSATNTSAGAVSTVNGNVTLAANSFLASANQGELAIVANSGAGTHALDLSSTGLTLTFDLSNVITHDAAHGGSNTASLQLTNGTLGGDSLLGNGANVLTFNLINASSSLINSPITLMTWNTGETGLTLANFATTLPAGYYLDSTFGTNGYQIVGNSLEVQIVPEPGTVAMMLLGLGALGFYYRRRLALSLARI